MLEGGRSRCVLLVFWLDVVLRVVFEFGGRFICLCTILCLGESLIVLLWFGLFYGVCFCSCGDVLLVYVPRFRCLGE